MLSSSLLLLFVDVGMTITKAKADVLKIFYAVDEIEISMTKKNDDEKKKEKNETTKKNDDDEVKLLALIIEYIVERLLSEKVEKV